MKAISLFLLLSLLCASPASATDNHCYRDGEYAIISGGVSPDGHWSIAARGGGPYGYDNFDLYLMREPAHKKLVPLHTSDELDTGPLSIVGLWAPDSSCVVILYRTDRHFMELQLYAVADGKVRPIVVPTLVSAIGQHNFKPGVHDERPGRFYRVTWQKSDRFALEEFDGYDAKEEIFSAGIEAYLTVDRKSAKRTFTYFAASAVCEITDHGKPRLSDVKPLKKWPSEIVYSPHLLYDSELGLHDTETSMSSLAAPKDGK